MTTTTTTTTDDDGQQVNSSREDDRPRLAVEGQQQTRISFFIRMPKTYF
jgi:hypothetical protein